jgi:hypothetical protein
VSTSNLALLIGGALLFLYITKPRPVVAGGSIGGFNWNVSGGQQPRTPGVAVDSTGSLIAGAGSAVGSILGGISHFFPSTSTDVGSFG